MQHEENLRGKEEAERRRRKEEDEKEERKQRMDQEASLKMIELLSKSQENMRKMFSQNFQNQSSTQQHFNNTQQAQFIYQDVNTEVSSLIQWVIYLI